MIAKNIGIIGLGFVGGAVRDWFGDGVAACSRSRGSFDLVDRREYIFLCLPTPYDVKNKTFDISALEENIMKLNPGKKVIIKSTLLPGTTIRLANKYRQHKFFFNPEFLTAAHAKMDFLYPPRQIIGYSNEADISTANEILSWLPDAPLRNICYSNEAEMVKIVANCYLATRVVFANQMYDYCKAKEIKYDEVIKMVVAGDPRIEPSHWQIEHEGYRGYSGYCFPKDMAATIADSGSELLAKAHELNDKYIKELKK